MYTYSDKAEKKRKRKFLWISILIHLVALAGFLLLDGVDIHTVTELFTAETDQLVQP